MTKSELNLKIYADGASWGNPGPSGIGIIIYDQRRRLIKQAKEFIGETTNNEAEYRALIYALIEGLILRAGSLTIYLDSELVVKQVNGHYKVKDSKLKPLHQEVSHLIKGFNRVRIERISRSANRDADKLASFAIKSSPLRNTKISK